MSLDLKREEAVPKGIRRLSHKRIGKASKTLTPRGGDGGVSDEAIHQTRKRLKQVRAILRVTRGELGRKQFRRENHLLRDAGRPLSQVRDAKVMLETLETLVHGGHRHLPSRLAARVQAALLARQNEIRGHILNDKRGMRAITRAVDKASRHVSKWPLKHHGWKALAPGLRKIYVRGHDALTEARRLGSDEALHQLRKRGKDLRYSLELLSRMEPATIGPLARAAHQFTDHLGQDHDLAVLQTLLDGELKAAVPARTRQQLKAPIASERAGLQKTALELGGRLYGEAADDFMKRMHKYWKAWRGSRQPQ